MCYINKIELNWTHILVKNILTMDLSQVLSSPDDNWWTGVLWCFNQTLILTAPIHCRASIAETLMQCYISPNLMKKKNTHLYLGRPANSISGWTIASTWSDIKYLCKNEHFSSLISVCFIQHWTNYAFVFDALCISLFDKNQWNPLKMFGVMMLTRGFPYLRVFFKSISASGVCSTSTDI